MEIWKKEDKKKNGDVNSVIANYTPLKKFLCRLGSFLSSIIDFSVEIKASKWFSSLSSELCCVWNKQVQGKCCFGWLCVKPHISDQNSIPLLLFSRSKNIWWTLFIQVSLWLLGSSCCWWGSPRSIITVQAQLLCYCKGANPGTAIRSAEGWTHFPALPETFLFFYLCLRNSGMAVLFSQGWADIFWSQNVWHLILQIE